MNVVQCLIYLDEPEQVASILENLIRGNNILMAYQLGFDLYENATQQFLLKVRTLLKALVTVTQPMEIGDATSAAEGEAKDDTVKIEPTTAADESKPKVNDEVRANIDRLLTILNGEVTIGTNMQFLIKNNHSDLLVLKTIKVQIIFKINLKKKKRFLFILTNLIFVLSRTLWEIQFVTQQP